MSYDLIALLTRNYTSHMVVALPEGPRLSREPANLLNIHSAKYSPLANAKVCTSSFKGREGWNSSGNGMLTVNVGFWE